jgi:hypothetical protein
MPARNGRILSSFGNWIAVCADHSCRRGVRCRMPDLYPPSICELQPLNAKLRTTRFFRLQCAPAGLRHLRWRLPHGGERRAPDLHQCTDACRFPRERKIVQESAMRGGLFRTKKSLCKSNGNQRIGPDCRAFRQWNDLLRSVTPKAVPRESGVVHYV